MSVSQTADVIHYAVGGNEIHLHAVAGQQVPVLFSETGIGAARDARGHRDYARRCGTQHSKQHSERHDADEYAEAREQQG